MNQRLQLTQRGWLVVGWAAAIGFVVVLGIAGWVEGGM